MFESSLTGPGVLRFTTFALNPQGYYDLESYIVILYFTSPNFDDFYLKIKVEMEDDCIGTKI